MDFSPNELAKARALTRELGVTIRSSRPISNLAWPAGDFAFVAAVIIQFCARRCAPSCSKTCSGRSSSAGRS